MAEKQIPAQYDPKRTFKCEPMLATEALFLKARLLRVIGGGVERLPLVLAAFKDGDTETAQSGALAAIVDIFSRTEPGEFVELAKDIASKARIRRPSGAYDVVDIDTDFQNDMDGLYTLLLFVLTVNYQDFLRGLGGKVSAGPTTTAA